MKGRLIAPKLVRRWYHNQKNNHAPWPKHLSPVLAIEGLLVFILKPIHRVQRRPERYRSAAQGKTQTGMKYLGSRRACAALCLAWPRAEHNAMIQWANAAREAWPHRNIPWPEIDLGTVLECGFSPVPQAAANAGQNQEQNPRNAHLRGRPDSSRSSSPSLPF